MRALAAHVVRHRCNWRAWGSWSSAGEERPTRLPVRHSWPSSSSAHIAARGASVPPADDSFAEEIDASIAAQREREREEAARAAGA
jgi:hypothetical protein